MSYMPKADFPNGALIMLILRVLQNGKLHGYAIAQRIRLLSADALQVEEGSLYPALQRILAEGWVTAAWGVSDTGRRVRFYTLSASGRKQLDAEVARHRAAHAAISAVLKNA
jgi:PadR family transcriptional regulator, regulatory protein PadR